LAFDNVACFCVLPNWREGFLFIGILKAKNFIDIKSQKPIPFYASYEIKVVSNSSSSNKRKESHKKGI